MRPSKIRRRRWRKVRMVLYWIVALGLIGAGVWGLSGCDGSWTEVRYVCARGAEMHVTPWSRQVWHNDGMIRYRHKIRTDWIFYKIESGYTCTKQYGRVHPSGREL